MILITGSSGFIGKKLLPLIRREYSGEKIFILEKKKHDLVTGKELEKIPGNPRLVFHLAAATDTSIRDQRCNDVGTKNLLSSLSGVGPDTHVVFTSSQAIFSGRKDTNKPISEVTKPTVNNNYGKTKLKAECILVNSAKKKKFKLTIIRLPTVWGENPRKNSFLNFLKSLVDKNSMFSRLNWPGKVALINVDAAAKFILNASQKPEKIISIAAENVTLAEIFKKITIEKGKDYKQIEVPEFIWDLARKLRPYLKYFEPILPIKIYNYLWRASIVVDSPLCCKVNVKGIKFTS
jgi:nucleoside-diphosphate-sugar epimerase